MMWSKVLGLALLPAAVNAFASTDTPSDVDPAQSGYIPNHNVDPTKIGSWAMSFKNTYNSLEGFYAKPLVYTPTGATSEQVIIVSSQNIVRVVDGKTGALLNSRALNPPFQSSDTLGCGDIPNTIGITGTPYIDSATDIMYFYSKGYQNSQAGPQGAINGQFLFYAVHLPSLADVAGFPVSIEGHFADNDHTRYFVGGTVNQRASLTSIGNTVIAGFGGHCDNFNYTGMLVAVSKTTGVGVTSIIAMEASPGAPQPQELDITLQGGGKAGIWQSGFGLAADAANSRIFFVTGNARGNGDNGGGVPVSGLGKPISTLQQATCSFTVDANGVLHQADYFEPYEYTTLNGGDRDFGSSGAALLDPYFSGGGVKRIVVAGGKSGKIYIMNADNLGGFANGGGGADAVIQTIVEGTSLLSGVASYPAEGGYIYFATTTNPLTCYSFNSATGQFTFAGQSALTLAGVGAPVVTSLNGQAGTAVVWVADVNQGLVAYNAIPVNGVLQPITFHATGRLMKYQRPSFGNARVYTFETNMLYGLGAPTSPPPAMTCTPSPLSFGPVTVGQTSTIQVTCIAGAAVTMNGCTSSLSTFQCQSFAGTVAAGASFQFGVTMNLTAAAIEADRLATPSNQIVPGSAVAALNLYNSAGVAQANIQASGTVIASGGYVVAGAPTVDFAGITACQTSASSVTLSNEGATVLTIIGFAWKDLKATNGPFNNITAGSPTVIGNQFTSATFPTINQQIAPGATITIPLTFAPKVAGSDASLVGFWTDGGYTDVMLVGSASGTCPVSSTSSSSSSSTKSSTSSSKSSSIQVSSSSSKSSSIKASTSSSKSSSIPVSSSSSKSSSIKASTSSSKSSSVQVSNSSSKLSSVSSMPSFPFLSSVLSSPSSSLVLSSSSSSSSVAASSSFYLPSSSTGPSSNPASTTTSKPSTLTTVTTSSTVTATAGPVGAYNYQGCYRDIPVGNALPLLFKNNSVTPELCEAYVASLAAKPTPTVLSYFYVEYHRECYGGSVWNFGSSVISSLTGVNACTDICSGSIGAATTGTAKCGGSKMFNLYAATTPVLPSVPITVSV